ncbi:MAG: putative DNA modification/repair radical SAM protein [Tissierellia bacterium]|nr:putative DNA modification/repair radical SAM protein [Tissierellia bacterium]
MNIQDKIRILTEGAKYDVSCSSSGSKRSRKKSDIMGNAHPSGICHSWSEDGRCISLLKILLTNKCIFDCTYCINRRSQCSERAEFTSEELIEITWEFYRRNYIEGLFLSSGIYPSPDETMEKCIAVLKGLRQRGFGGYIHSKGIPGADPLLLREMGKYADRMSINIELPTQKGLLALAPQKKVEVIETSMMRLKEEMLEARESKHKVCIPGGQSTQMIIGASGETDREIITKAESLYQKMSLKRVYYSAFIPVLPSPLAPDIKEAPLLREHRIYQGDFLLRFYGFQGKELLNKENPNFNPSIDPKAHWALEHFDLFPMEINRVSYEELLRIPGFGPRTVQKILGARKLAPLKPDDLKSLKIPLKRAKYFITVGGRAMGLFQDNPEMIREKLIDPIAIEQLSFFGGYS